VIYLTLTLLVASVAYIGSRSFCILKKNVVKPKTEWRRLHLTFIMRLCEIIMWAALEPLRKATHPVKCSELQLSCFE
jgi:hypothetical protein